MNDQIAMFVINPDLADDTTHSCGDAPTCPACRLRPARYNHTRNEYSRYCSGAHCSNHQRRCTWCGTTYDRAAPGSGIKYCSDSCKAAGYKPDRAAARPTTPTPCAICANPIRSRTKRAQVCSPCRSRYIGQIESHRLDTHWAVRLITATHCDSCGERLTSAHGKHKGQVDHKHTCCPGSRSCSECVRGIICQRCNTIAAAIENDPDRHHAVRTYLDKP